MGLAIVKEIILMHSGRIEVESEVDHGTTFTVFLPLNELPQEQVACKSAKK
ncbi:MAG: ATP-binding protein [Planctomycetota bacterium]